MGNYKQNIPTTRTNVRNTKNELIRRYESRLVIIFTFFFKYNLLQYTFAYNTSISRIALNCLFPRPGIN